MRYEAPTSTREAIALMSGAKGDAYLLAGGTDLLVRMRGEFIDPDLVVDIKRLPGIQEIRKTARGFSIGAGVPCAALGRHKPLLRAWPGVVEAAQLIGSDQIQGRCTIAGNLCNASPAADSVPALVAATAKAVIVGPGGRRRLAVEKIITGPGATSLGKGDIVSAIELPNRPPKSGDAYLRFIPRTEMDIAVCSAGVSLTLGPRNVVKQARVALGAVAPTVVLVPKAARAIVGTRLEDDALQRLAAACEAACSPIDDKRGTVEFRTEVAGVLARRAAVIAYERARKKR
ncbi:xanthine dehydrogenase family protein subunit M [Gammaproteobacteria bacterium]|nr:xanthine dehydrogenase family protein subunit M [Gammaproteobacteria bacterium]